MESGQNVTSQAGNLSVFPVPRSWTLKRKPISLRTLTPCALYHLLTMMGLSTTTTDAMNPYAIAAPAVLLTMRMAILLTVASSCGSGRRQRSMGSCVCEGRRARVQTQLERLTRCGMGCEEEGAGCMVGREGGTTQHTGTWHST